MNDLLPLLFFCGTGNATQVCPLSVKKEGGRYTAHAGQNCLTDGVIGQQMEIIRSGFLNQAFHKRLILPLPHIADNADDLDQFP